MTTVKLVESDTKVIDTIYKYDDNALNMALSCDFIIWESHTYKILESKYDMDNKIAIIVVRKT